jgi:ferredoxin
MAAPTLFDLDDAGNLAVVLVPEPDEGQRPLVEAAVRACPVRAILTEG